MINFDISVIVNIFNKVFLNKRQLIYFSFKRKC